MKIALMTWHSYHNYGTMLQATALAHVLKSKGHIVHFIDYDPRNVKTEPLNFNMLLKRLKKRTSKTASSKLYTNNAVKFDEYNQNTFEKTEKCDSYTDLYQLNKDYDCFICGSDQIWTPNSFNTKYFLDFANENKIIAYAPSFGVSQVNNEYVKAELPKYLNRFKALSVREEQGAKIIEELTGQSAKVVVDPTLLLSSEEWVQYENKDLSASLSKKNYIVTYFLGKSDCYYKNIIAFAKKNSYDIINIPIYKNMKLNQFNLKEKIGPKEFLSIIKNAACVFTDSFHGTIFSINFNINFYTFKRFSDKSKTNQNSRIYNVLKKFDLSERLVGKNLVFSDNSIEYNKNINDILKSQKEESIKFLYDALLNVNEDYIEDRSGSNITEYCSGCGACAAICPTGAITLELNDEGFLHSKFNQDKCIKCGQCKNVCPMRNVNASKIDNNKELYSFKTTDLEILRNSSSGGFSYLLSKFLSKDYYVCGCTYDNNEDIAKHIIIEPNNFEKLKMIQGSKYIQSHNLEAYTDMLKIAKNNKILFFGTPCQVAGLDKILKIRKMRDKFILVDLICHGVPTINLWNKYLNEIFANDLALRKEHNIIFRKGYLTKDRKYIIELTNKDGKTLYTNDQSKDDFYAFFNDCTCFNKSCFECPYRAKSVADIRMGDYWGKKYEKDTTGISMIILMSDLGKKSFNEMTSNEKCEISKCEVVDYYTYQKPYNQRAAFYRKELLNDLKNSKVTLKNLRKKYFKYEFLKKIRKNLYKMKRIIKHEK